MARLLLMKEIDWQAILADFVQAGQHALVSYEHYNVLNFPAWCLIRLKREETWAPLKTDARIINLGRRGDRGVARLAPALVQKLGAIAPDAATVNDVVDDLTGFSSLFDG